LSYGQLLVSCGGGRRPADGLRKQHVRTYRLPVWDTLEDFSPLRTARRTRRRRFTKARCTYVDNSAQNDGRASKQLDFY
jgi:hypothetical protein